jgi:hypothetical protein
MATKKAKVSVPAPRGVKVIPEGRHQRIVIAAQSNVFVGEYTYDPEAETVVLYNAHCIRVFGTTAGLGQLAVQGVQEKTILDYYGIVCIPKHSVAATIICDPAFWAVE